MALKDFHIKCLYMIKMEVQNVGKRNFKLLEVKNSFCLLAQVFLHVCQFFV